MDKDEPFNLGEDTESITPGRSPSNALDTFLSGYYIIEDIVYRTTDGETKQHVTLLRREWPTRTDNLLNPPGLAEDATPEKKAENVKENSPPPPAPTATPAPPTPTATPSADVPLEVEVTMNGGNITQDAWSPFMSQNTFVKLTGTWKANREIMFDDAYAIVDQSGGEGDSFDINSGNGLRVKKDGTIILDMYETGGIMEAGNYTVKVTLEAEGKKFKIKPNGVVSFTVVDAPKP
jgi:hypothetical protein